MEIEIKILGETTNFDKFKKEYISSPISLIVLHRFTVVFLTLAK